jgi:predicted DNA-binding transcriptional regulator AlpA
MFTAPIKTSADNIAQAEMADNTEATLVAKPARFISKREMLDRVGASYSSVWLWMRRGTFPRSRELGGKAVFIESEIEEFILNSKVRRLKGDP